MKKQKSHRRWLILGCLSLLLAMMAGGAAWGKPQKIVFADLSWDSIQVHNRIAGFIIKHGLGYEPEYVAAETVLGVTGVMMGDIDVDMESWTENIQEVYDKGIRQGKLIDLGPCFPDSWQGWLVPTYMIKGDPERGIKPSAPGLKSVYDMPKYWKLFQDPETPDKGRFYNCIAGWACAKYNEQRLKAYGLDKYYTNFIPGSDAALSGSMMAAYKKGNAWFGYYWAPTWVLGKLDMTPLEEPPYDPAVWESTKGCGWAPTQVNILINHKLPQKAPDVVAFLKKYETNQKMNNKFLAYMQDTKAKTDEAAVWFLKNYEPVWTQWVSDEVAAKVKAALP